MSKNSKSTQPVADSKAMTAALRTFKAAVKSEAGSRIKASRAAFAFEANGGKRADLISKSGVSKSTVSRYVLAGKALDLVPDADDQTAQSVANTAFGYGGDRNALVQAVKDESAPGVVAAATATPETDKKSGHKSGANKGKDSGVKVADLSTEALLALYVQVVEAIATRDDMPGEHADTFVKHTKAAATIAKNLAAIPVA